MTTSCVQCQAPVADERLTCEYCGTPRSLPTNPEEERRTSLEIRGQLQSLLAEMQQGETTASREKRNRYVRSAFVPSSALLLLDELTFLRQFFTDDPSACEPARLRFEACLMRLELLSSDDAGLIPKVAVLKKELADQRAREAAFSRSTNRGILIFLAVLVGGIIALAKACG